jgi:hypothetical protein
MKQETKTVTRTEALEMRKAWEMGETQYEIAKRFSGMGFVTRKGNPLQNYDVSYYINNKAKGRKPYQKKADQVSAILTLKSGKKSSLDQKLVIEILTNPSLTDEKKVKTLIAIAE